MVYSTIHREPDNSSKIKSSKVWLTFQFYRPCQSERSSKARHEADSFEPAEWSERLTPGQSGWLAAAAVGSIPALALSLFLQRLYWTGRFALTGFLSNFFLAEEAREGETSCSIKSFFSGLFWMQWLYNPTKTFIFNVYIFFSFFNVYIYLFALFVQLPFLLFVLCRFVLAASSACFFPFFFPPPNPQSTMSART